MATEASCHRVPWTSFVESNVISKKVFLATIQLMGRTRIANVGFRGTVIAIRMSAMEAQSGNNFPQGGDRRPSASIALGNRSGQPISSASRTALGLNASNEVAVATIDAAAPHGSLGIPLL